MPRRITYRDAIREALDEEIARDPMVVVMGEEVAQYNGAYKVTQGLWDKWGDKRLVDTPISEAGFIGMGIGASMLGVRPVMELMFWSFYTVAWDQIVNNGAMVRYMSGTSVGATHSHTPENIMANFPGMKCVCPSNAYDAKGLMKAAIRDNDPVMFMESTKLYGEEWDVPANDELPGGELYIPLGLADVKRELLKSMKSAFTGKAESQASPASGPAPKKKKSLELLANNLLQKALAQLAGDVEPPPKVSVQNGPVVELVTKTDSDPAEQVSSCPAEPVPSCPIEPIPSCPAEPVHSCPAAGKPARDVPSLGLCLIADSYVSSEEEES